MQQQNKFMEEALKEAKKCFESCDVPVGCVIVQRGKIIARAHNQRVRNKNTISHCEILAISKACKKVKDWRLDDCCMYVTLEPCPMCAGAILQARLKRVVIGTENPKAGCCGSVINLLNHSGFNHCVDIEYGLLKQECAGLIKEFFRQLRKNEKRDNII